MGRIALEPNKLVKTLTALLLGWLLLGASVPTPAPGNGALLPAPSPNNPVQFNLQPNTLADANQVNSSFYKNAIDLNAIIAYLNGTTSIGQSYTCPFCITGINLSGGLTGSVTPAGPNGATATIGFNVPIPVSVGGTGSTTQNFVDLGTNQTIFGNKVFAANVQSGTNGSFFHTYPNTQCGGSNQGGLYSSTSLSAQGVFASLFGLGCVNPLTLAVAVDTNGNIGANALYANTLSITGTSYLAATQISGSLLVGQNISLTSLSQYISHGTRDTFPWLANIYNSNTHMEAGATSAVSPSGASYAFKQPYTAGPICIGSYNSPASPPGGVSVAASTSAATVYGPSFSGSGASVICVGY